jgi:SH3-like domain-containing protein
MVLMEKSGLAVEVVSMYGKWQLVRRIVGELVVERSRAKDG